MREPKQISSIVNAAPSILSGKGKAKQHAINQADFNPRLSGRGY
jgi:hypothetical protein